MFFSPFIINATRKYVHIFVLPLPLQRKCILIWWNSTIFMFHQLQLCGVVTWILYQFWRSFAAVLIMKIALYNLRIVIDREWSLIYHRENIINCCRKEKSALAKNNGRNLSDQKSCAAWISFSQVSSLFHRLRRSCCDFAVFNWVDELH